MARRERKIVAVMVHLEPFLSTHMDDLLDDIDDRRSTYLRGLLVKDLQERGRLNQTDLAALSGAASR